MTNTDARIEFEKERWLQLDAEAVAEAYGLLDPDQPTLGAHLEWLRNGGDID